MHFLCLHGKGTNSRLVGQILEIQTAALRYRLGEEHTYDFVEGSIPCDAAPNVDMISSEDRGFFAYFDDSSLSSCRQSLEDLEHYVKISGPFDGLMAFSMGAVLGATLLVRQAQNGAEVPFRLAIFFCGGVPGDPTALDQNAFRLLDSTTDGEIIGLPTAHIWAHNDPSTLSSPELAKLCIAQLKTTFIHECGHNIPSWNDKNALDKTVQCIQKTIDRAMTFH